jgi:hypothetical protein
VAGACECGDRSSGSIKCWEFFWLAEDLLVFYGNTLFHAVSWLETVIKCVAD